VSRLVGSEMCIRDRRSMGQGIGLSVVRELVEIYRGSIELSESPLGGACVTVRLLGC
jgi:signal transduction histidine kinase